jgi:hypothetical protein
LVRRPQITEIAALEPAPPSLYADAVAAYVAAVAPRARAIYQVGRRRGDGLSDLDLIVIPDAPRLDNSQYYSAKLRVRFARRLFPHDVRPLPSGALDAIAYTSHSAGRLVFGEDLLADVQMSRGPEQDFGLLLEGFLKYERFVADCAKTGSVRAERLLSKATSLAYSLEIFDRIAGDALAPGYSAASLALRQQLAVPGASREPQLVSLWELYSAALALLEARLAERLPLHRGEPVAEFARAYLGGARELCGLDSERAAARREAIARYHRELARERFFIGSLFAKAAYGEMLARERQRYAPPRLVTKALRVGYRVRAWT